MDQSNRRQYSGITPGYANAVQEAELYGVPRTLAEGATLAGAGVLYSVPVPTGCNRALIKSKVTGHTSGQLIVYHGQQRERQPGSALVARVATLQNTNADDAVVVQLPPGSGYLTATVASLGTGSMDAEAIFWREN